MTEGGVCTDCITGSLHEGTPKGTISTIAKLPTYVAKPVNTRGKPGVIVIITDMFGWDFINNRLLADEYAEASGRTIYVPDFMFGNSPSPGFLNTIHPIDGSIPSMFQKIGGYLRMILSGVPWFFWHRQSVTIPIIKSFFQILRTENPDLKIGVAGFCWGGRYALLLGQEHFSDIHLVDAVFAGHPSLVSIPDDVEAPYCPISVAVASTDRVFSTKMAAKVEELWKKRAEDVKTEIVIYEGAKHGFCVRGNMKVEQEKKDMEKAIQQAVKWFSVYMA